MAKKQIRGLIMGLAIVMSATLFASCATASSIGGTSDVHGLISSAKEVSNGAEEIGSYSVLIGLLDSGYAEYVAAVKAAEASGKKIVTVTTQYLTFFTKVTAYASN
jgi:hypothetical protein